ncbi:MAG: hypothetical protein ACWGKN_10445 [Desulfoprunum sp.]
MVRLRNGLCFKSLFSDKLLGITATTNNGGAGKWRDHHSDQLKGAKVVILPDNDAPGRSHGEKVANLLFGKAEEIRILALPNLPEKGDVIDYLNGEDDIEELITRLRDMAEDAPLYQADLPEDAPTILEEIACSSTEFLGKKVKKPQTLIHPVFREQSLSMIYAKAGAGKSWLAHSIATPLQELSVRISRSGLGKYVVRAEFF